MTMIVHRIVSPNNFLQIIGNESQNELVERLQFLNLCQCCDRHKTNKPRFFDVWIETPESSRTQEEPINQTCDCPCRHMARFVCRQHKDYKPNYSCVYITEQERWGDSAHEITAELEEEF